MADTPKTALVTGGAKRVGRAIVTKLAREGFHIVFTHHHSAADARALCDQLNIAGAAVSTVHADFSDPLLSTRQLAECFQNDQLDLLVNNASLYRPGKVAELREQASLTSELMRVNFESPLMLAEIFANKLRAAKGHVVNMLDLLAEKPWPEYLSYCASKAALANATLSLARALAPDVTVNGIAPGVVDWPAGFPEEQKKTYLSRVPLGRAGTPEEVANLVHFLATGGSYITGQIIRLDGGRSIV